MILWLSNPVLLPLSFTKSWPLTLLWALLLFWWNNPGLWSSAVLVLTQEWAWKCWGRWWLRINLTWNALSHVLRCTHVAHSSIDIIWKCRKLNLARAKLIEAYYLALFLDGFWGCWVVGIHDFLCEISSFLFHLSVKLYLYASSELILNFLIIWGIKYISQFILTNFRLFPTTWSEISMTLLISKWYQKFFKVNSMK